MNKDRLIFVTLRFIAFDIVLEKSVPEFNASATSAPRQNKCRCADAPMVTVNTTSVRRRSIIASAAHALFVVKRDRLIIIIILL